MQTQVDVIYEEIQQYARKIDRRLTAVPIGGVMVTVAVCMGGLVADLSLNVLLATQAVALLISFLAVILSCWFYDPWEAIDAFVRKRHYDDAMLRALARRAYQDLRRHGRRIDIFVAGSLGVERIIAGSEKDTAFGQVKPEFARYVDLLMPWEERRN